ncbi:MAG: ester cyclase [Candidatus Nanopelagicales bacterium]
MPDVDLDSWIRRYYDRVVNARDLAAIDDLVAPNYVGSGLGWASTLEKLREFYIWQATYRPDWRIDVQDTLQVADWVAVRAHAGGTVSHDDVGQPLDASYRRAVEWLTVSRIVDGRLSETRFLSVRDRDNPTSRGLVT